MMNYSEYFKGTVPGTPAFSALWKKAPLSFPNFAEDQHEFIKKTHYAPQVAFLKEKGIDLENRGNAVQDAVWSTSVQFGPHTSLIAKSLQGKKVDEMTDADIVSVIQDYKIANNNVFFKSSSPAVRTSTLNRAKNEKRDLLNMIQELD